MLRERSICMISLNRASEGEGEMIWDADLLMAASAKVGH